MKKFLTIVAALAFSITAFAQVPQISIQTAHATSLHIGAMSRQDAVKCSATVIGPQAILTASHCEVPSDTLFIEGYDQKIRIERIMRDDADHSIYLLAGVSFTHFAKVDLNYKAAQGEPIFEIGNPGTWSDIYRQGYVAGYIDLGDLSVMLIDINGWHGDSGAGIFNSAGTLIGVTAGRVSQGDTADDQILLGYVYPLMFSPAELVEALAYTTPVEPATPVVKGATTK